MDEKRQKNRPRPASLPERKGEARTGGQEGTRASIAVTERERPSYGSEVMEEIARKSNVRKALERVTRNAGAAGVDGMRTDQLRDHLNEHWPTIKAALLEGKYRPLPVRRVEIPKPDGGVRLLGIPTVMDRLVQQAILQVLQPRWDPTFSNHSHGFRPGRHQHGAIAEAQRYLAEGYGWVVDLDLEKFFDQVDHDRLMSELARRIADKRLLRLIRSFLGSGVMIGGLAQATERGTPQGGPLSPFLSNVVLDELDRELERRGHRFVRYADDCNIYVQSERAGQRVMTSISEFITRRLKLRVNEAKSAVARPEERKFLGFSFRRNDAQVERVISPASLRKVRQKVRSITGRTRGRSFGEIVAELSSYLRGWVAYYGFTQMSGQLKALDKWIRRRLRAYLWKQWKTIERRRTELIRLGVARGLARRAAGSSKGPWVMSHVEPVEKALTLAFFRREGLFFLAR